MSKYTGKTDDGSQFTVVLSEAACTQNMGHATFRNEGDTVFNWHITDAGTINVVRRVVYDQKVVQRRRVAIFPAESWLFVTETVPE